MSSAASSGVADIERNVKELRSKVSQVDARRVLAEAIERVGDTDEVLSRRTGGQVSPEEIALYRKGNASIPHWKRIVKLLSRCSVAPSRIGQRLRSPH